MKIHGKSMKNHPIMISQDFKQVGEVDGRGPPEECPTCPLLLRCGLGSGVPCFPLKLLVRIIKVSLKGGPREGFCRYLSRCFL